MSKIKKIKKRHPIRHGIGMVFASLFLIIVMIVNVIAFSISSIIDGFIDAPYSQVEASEKEATEASAVVLANQIEAQGSVLLQNNEGALPLKENLKKVNIFGWASTAWIGGGSGSGGVTRVDVDLLTALTEYGIEYNTALTDMYKNFQSGREYSATLNSWPEQSYRLYEPAIDDEDYYTGQILTEALDYSDTAIVVFGRPTGESNDCTKKQYKRLKQNGEIIIDDSRTYLDLSVEEEDLLRYVGENYANVIVLLNVGNVMAIGQIETIPGVDACLLIGFSGQSGAGAIPAMLWGEIEPGGKTADTWAYDLASAASYANAGLEGTGAYENAEGLYPADGTLNGNLGETWYYDQVSYVDYTEGIYIGYKWYETADAEGYWADVQNEYGRGYEGVVQYPFGFGLSYTSFEWEIVDYPKEGTLLTEDGSIIVKVKVTNTGERAGSDVVQLYYSAPYMKGEIEKSAIELAAYEKTKRLEPGENQELTLSFKVEDMASYDCYDSNNNGFTGYELDAGIYSISVRSDAHTIVDAENAIIDLELKEDVKYSMDSFSGAVVNNKFTGSDAVDGISLDGNNSNQNIAYMTRADFKGTFPRENISSRPLSENAAALNLYSSDMIKEYINEADEPITTGAKNGLVIEQDGLTTELGYQLGADFNDPLWEDLLDQITVDEMENMYINAYGNTAAIKSIGKLQGKDADGPVQIGSMTGLNAGTGFPSSTILAQTWNTQLALEMGQIIGTQAIQNSYSGWYAPAVNMHRSPFNGRNYEYYSEDSILSGLMCGKTVEGAQQMGVYVYVKHFICNDGESGIFRDSVYTWMTEQALREIYLEPFRIIVQDFDATGLMSSYNRIGAVWAGGSDALLTSILRDEWGFRGAVITDYSDHHAFMNGDQALRTGGSLWMSGIIGGTLTEDTSSNSYMQALRRATKETLYMYLHVRAINRDYSELMQDDSILRPVFTKSFIGWRQIIIVIDIIAVLLFILAIRGLIIDHRLKKQKKEENA